jgi:hypothetical protein
LALSQFFSQLALSQFFSQLALSQSFSQLALSQSFSQLALSQSFSQFLVHSVAALLHVASLALLLQHDVRVKATTATMANNTFLIINHFLMVIQLVFLVYTANVRTFCDSM